MRSVGKKKSHDVSFSETFYQPVCYIQVISLCGQPPAWPPQPQLKAEYIISSLRGSAGSLLEQLVWWGWVGNGHHKLLLLQGWVQEGFPGSLLGQPLRTNFQRIVIPMLYFVFRPAAIFQAHMPAWEVWRCARAQSSVET